MGISRRSTFLHALASSSGVRVGGVSVSIESDSLFERWSIYAVACFSSEAIEKEEAKEERRGEGGGEEGRRRPESLTPREKRFKNPRHQARSCGLHPGIGLPELLSRFPVEVTDLSPHMRDSVFFLSHDSWSRAGKCRIPARCQTG